jgi:regulator of replication initiation timing
MEDENIAEEIKQLEQQIQATQTDVDNLRTELQDWEARRHREAAMTLNNMADRASRVVDQPETSLSPVDLDAIL